MHLGNVRTNHSFTFPYGSVYHRAFSEIPPSPLAGSVLLTNAFSGKVRNMGLGGE